MGASDTPCKKCCGERRIIVRRGPKTPEEKKEFWLLKNYPAIPRKHLKEVLCPRCNGEGSELPNKNRRNSQRGKGFERRVGKDLRDWWQKVEPGCDFQRTPSSGGSALAEGWGLLGDLSTNAQTWPALVECKNQQAWSFDDFFTPKGGKLGEYIDQVLTDCPSGKIPFVVMTHPGPSKPVYVMVVIPTDLQIFLLGTAPYELTCRHLRVEQPCGKDVAVIVMPFNTLLESDPIPWQKVHFALQGVK